MRGEQVVAQRADLVEGEFGGGVRVEPVVIGGGTVGIQVLGSDLMPAGETLLQAVRMRHQTFEMVAEAVRKRLAQNR